MQLREFLIDIEKEGITVDKNKLEYKVENNSGDVSGGKALAIVSPEKLVITIGINDKEKRYEAGDGTTFPCEFIKDYRNGYFK